MKTTDPNHAHAGSDTIRRALPTDARAIARLHRRGLPNSFLGSLGPWLLQVIYRRLVRDDLSRVLIAHRGGRAIGFVAGTLDGDRLVARTGVGRLIPAVSWLLRPDIRRRVATTASFAGSRDLPRAELLAIAVAPEHQRTGIAAQLTRALAAQLRDAGAREFRVLVDTSNEAANLFWAALGFTLAGTTPGRSGKDVNVWTWWKPQT